MCSTNRRDSCRSAQRFARRATALGVTNQVIQQPLSHREINEQLGTPGAYTESVESFLRTLDYSFARALRS